MADILDQASELEAMLTRAATLLRKPTGPVAKGECLYCGEPLDDGLRWCDASCRDEFERTP